MNRRITYPTQGTCSRFIDVELDEQGVIRDVVFTGGCHGNLGTQGSLSFLFDHKAVFTFKKKDGLDMDELILDLIDYGVDDEFDEDEETGEITIYAEPTSFGELQKHLETEGFEVTGAEFTRIPNDLKEVTEEQRATIDKMVEKLEEFDDVQTVYTNMKPE